MVQGDNPKLALGARPKQPRESRGQNRLNAERVLRAAQMAQVQAAPVQPDTLIPTYEEGTRVTRDRTSTPGIVGEVVNQYGDTCVSVAACSLLQGIYNHNKPIAQHHRFCWRDLDKHIRTRTSGSVVYNLNMVFDYASERGLLKRSDTGRSNIGGQGFRIYGTFDQMKEATRDDVYAIFENTLVAICLQTFGAFHALEDEIYEVPLNQKANHAVLIVGKGVTRLGQEFLVIQNSWGSQWGNKGYARICLNPESRFQIFWATGFRV